MKKIYLLLIISALSVCISYAQKPVARFVVSKDTTCQYGCVNFTDSSTNNPTSWKWTFHGNIDSTSTVQNPQNICYPFPGGHDVTLIATNANGSDTLNQTDFITVRTSPPLPEFSISEDTLFCIADSSIVSYQWYVGATPIQGATNRFYIMDSCGNYDIMVTNSYGCNIEEAFYITQCFTEPACPLGIKDYLSAGLISVSPNPASNQLNIHTSSVTSSLVSNDDVTVSIMNVLGEIVQEEKQKWMNNMSVNINRLAPGVYFLQMKSESGSVVKKFVKE